MWTAFGESCIPLLAILLGCQANFLHVVPKEQIKPWTVLMSDGTFKETTGASYEACGVGPGLVYLPLNDGSDRQDCYNEDYIRLKRGSVNQISKVAARTNFANSTVTYLQYEWWSDATATLILAAKYGKIHYGNTLPSGVKVTGTATATANNNLRVTAFKVSAGALITAQDGWKVCDSSAYSCGTSLTGQASVNYYFAYGPGVKLIVVGKTSQKNNIPNGSDQDAIFVENPNIYLTAATDHFTTSPTPIAVEVESWLSHGAPSVHKLLIDSFETTRSKRFAGLALAIANRIELESIKTANRAAAAISDRNNNKLADQGFSLEVADKKQAVDLGRMIKRYEAQQLEIRVSNREIEYLRILAANLGQKQRAMDITIMQIARFLQLRETTPDEHLTEVREKVKNEVSGTIIIEYSDPDNYYFVISENQEGKPVMTNDPDALCGKTFCHHTGNWTQIRGVGESVDVTGPLVGAMSCGIYLLEPSETIVAVLKNQPDSVTRFDYFLQHNADLVYSYANPRDCGDEEVLSNTLLNTARLQLQNQGFDGIRIDEEDKFYINCTQSFNGSEGLNTSFAEYLERNALCDRRMASDEFLANALALTPHRVEVESSLDAFNKVMAEQNEIGAVMRKLVSGTATTFAEAAGIAKDSWDYAFGDEPQNVRKIAYACLGLVFANLIGNGIFSIVIIFKVRQISATSHEIHENDIELDTTAKKEDKKEDFSVMSID